LNTAARIQSVCNEYNKSLLVSQYLLNKTGENHNMQTEALGMIGLRGKMAKVGIVSIKWMEDEVKQQT
jgi:adenylate cyclase